MSKESFLLVSLKEDKAKKLAQVVSNDSCRKILDYLTEKEATESELSEKLGIPISTVHYNLKQLVDSNLVTADEFHYSGKGKEVMHYKLANKYIIIAPKSVFGIKEKLKRILPVAIVVAATGFIIDLVKRYGLIPARKIADEAVMAAPQMLRAVPEVATETAKAATNEAGELVADMAAGAANAPEPVLYGAADGIHVIQNEPSIVWWFIGGAAFAILIYLLVEYIIYKFRK